MHFSSDPFEEMSHEFPTKKRTVVECNHCHKNISVSNAIKIDNDYFCPECFNKLYTMCNHCHKYMKRDSEEIVKAPRGSAVFCKKCYKELYLLCEGCDKPFHRHNEMLASPDGQHLYCRVCWDRRYGTCRGCGRHFHLEDLRIERDGHYCAHCWERVRPRSPLIHPYNHHPDPVFKKLKDEKEMYSGLLYMGIELEIEGKKNIDSNKIADKLQNFLSEEKVDNSFYFKHDGSLQNGFEIVSHPFTYLYARKYLKFEKILTWLRNNGAQSYESGRCGLHVHINRDFFNELEVAKMRLFFSKNKEQLYKFSGRAGVNDEYCAYEPFECKNFIRNGSQQDRRHAINLNSSRDTVELRIFRGTLNHKKFIAILQFVEALAYFVKEVGTTSLIFGEGKYKNNSWNLFTTYIREKNKNDYETLVEILKKEELCV